MKKTTTLILAITIIVIILISLIFFLQTSHQQKKVKIGAIIPLTGKTAYLGLENQKAIVLAEERIKKQFGDGSIEIVIEDSQGDSKVAVAAANKLIEIDQVDVLYVESTGPSTAISPIALDNNVIMMYSSSSKDILSKNPLAIKASDDPEQICKRFADISKEKRIEKIAVINEMGATIGLDCEKGLNKVYLQENTIVETITAGSDIKTTILKLNDQDVGAFVFYAFEGTCLSYYKIKMEFDLNQLVFGPDGGVITDNIINTVGIENLEDTFAYTKIPTEYFREEYSSKFGEVDNSLLQKAVVTYDIILKLDNAVRNCESKDNVCIINKILIDKTENTAIESYDIGERIVSPVSAIYTIDNGEKIRVN